MTVYTPNPDDPHALRYPLPTLRLLLEPLGIELPDDTDDARNAILVSAAEPRLRIADGGGPWFCPKRWHFATELIYDGANPSYIPTSGWACFAAWSGTV